MTVLYVAGFSTAAYFAWQAAGYYGLALAERPLATEMHKLYKPGGLVGHGLGIVGGTMVLALFLYPARKRRLPGLRWGTMSRWLTVHIWFGITGPILITLHTALKFGGIVSISYFSMMAVMLSGFFGRYLYSMIPRGPGGDALSRKQIDELVAHLGETLTGGDQTTSEIARLTDRYAGQLGQPGIITWGRILAFDLTRPIRPWLLGRSIHRVAPDLPRTAVQQISKRTHQRAMLVRRRRMLDSVNRVFDLWHVVHKPFAYVAVIIMFLHIAVALLMGSRWVF